MSDIADIAVTALDGQQHTLGSYLGKATLVVNVASKCGLTPQYEGLEALYTAYKDRGLMVLGFPCNQFGNQEPGSAEEIQSFCSLNYDVDFPMFSKIEVNGPGTHPLYRLLKAAAPGFLGSQKIKWNFTKFLIDRQGRVVKRFSPTTKPEKLSADIAKLLDTQADAVLG
jgi:glutathione peroxidase